MAIRKHFLDRLFIQDGRMKQFEHAFLLLYINIMNLRCSVNSFEGKNRKNEGEKSKFQEAELKQRAPFTW